LKIFVPKTFEFTCFDLFAGAGGFSLGFEQAGFDSLGMLEKDNGHVIP